VVVVLILAAALRILELSRLPPGFSVDEIANIQVSETARRLGTIASFYNVGNSTNGHEGLYPVLQALVTSVIGDGLFCYRVLAFWCGLLSVALMYALVRRLFGRFAGLAAAIALCVTFWPILLSRSAVRETLLLPLFLATLLALAWVVHLRRETFDSGLYATGTPDRGAGLYPLDGVSRHASGSGVFCVSGVDPSANFAEDRELCHVWAGGGCDPGDPLHHFYTSFAKPERAACLLGHASPEYWRTTYQCVQDDSEHFFYGRRRSAT